MPGRTRSNRRTALAALAAATLLLTACGSGDDADSSDKGDSSPEAEASPPSANKLANQVNKAMSETTFHAKGSTRSLDGGTQEMWSDPKVGLRIKVTAPGQPDGETFCAKNTVYTSAELVVTQLKQRDEEVELPKGYEGKYVSSQAAGGCARLYEIYPGTTLDPKLDDEVDGVPTTAVVAESQDNKDVYQVAKKGAPLMLRLDSEYQGEKSTTEYGSFGEAMEITLPPKDKVVTMEKFREALT